MTKTIATLCALFYACFLAGCGGGGGSDSSPVPAPVGGKTISQSINSVQAGQFYDLSIYLPPDYDRSSGSYPIIYLMDAESRFAPSLAVLQQSGVDAILVGIGNVGNNRRNIDFQMPGATSSVPTLFE